MLVNQLVIAGKIATIGGIFAKKKKPKEVQEGRIRSRLAQLMQKGEIDPSVL